MTFGHITQTDVRRFFENVPAIIENNLMLNNIVQWVEGYWEDGYNAGKDHVKEQVSSAIRGL